MVDSVAILPPGWRAFDANGALLTDAVLNFFDAGTTDALEVFSESALSSSLGTTVDCNSTGYPVSSGNNKTLIYTGVDPYKIRLTSVIAGGTVFEFDNVRGALDTSTFLTSAAVADIDIVPVSTNRSVTTADKGKLLNVNCSGGTIVITLDAADDIGDGFSVGIRHDGTANAVRITADGTDEFAISGVNTVAFALTGRGQTIWIACDGVGFKTYADMPPLIGGTNGVIVIADRLSSPPVSPNAGQRYILTSSPSGAWSTFAEHDIAEADGSGGWFKYTPATDCGWIAYVQDEDSYYNFSAAAWGNGTQATPYSAGTQSSGTFTPNPRLGMMQTATNGGAHTLAPPSVDCTMIIQYTNNASAGAITTSGFTLVDGDSNTTTNGHDFFFYITKVGSFSRLTIAALQ